MKLKVALALLIAALMILPAIAVVRARLQSSRERGRPDT
jgi:hypothetical protein